jgi:hypothetical protein
MSVREIIRGGLLITLLISPAASCELKGHELKGHAL